MVKTGENLRKLNWDFCFRIIFLLFFVVSSVYQIRYGANCDVAMQTSWSSRTARGDFPLVDTWGPFCISSWFIGFLYRIFYLFSPYFTYGFLILKILGVLFQCVVAIQFYQYIKNNTSERQAFWGSAIFVIFVPYYMYIFVSHYNISYWLTLLLAMSLMQLDARTERCNILLITIELTVMILSMPTMMIMVPITLAMIVIFEKKHKKVAWGIIISMICIFFLGIVILYLHGGSFTDIFYLLEGGDAHGAGLLSQIIKRFKILVPITLITVCYTLFAKKIFRTKYEFLILICLLSVFSIAVWVYTGECSQLMRAVFFSDIILGIWSCLHYKDVHHSKAYIYMCMYGCALGVICALSTNTGSMVTSIGMILPFVAYITLSNIFNKSRNAWFAIGIFIALIFIQRICICDGWVNCTGISCTEKIEAGILKGIYVRPEHAEKYNRIWRVMDKNVKSNDMLLLTGDERTLYYGYLMTEARNAGNTVDDMENGFKTYEAYYLRNEQKIPNIIIMPGNEFVSEIQEADSEFIRWVKDNYSLKNIDEGYLILKKTD